MFIAVVTCGLWLSNTISSANMELWLSNITISGNIGFSSGKIL